MENILQLVARAEQKATAIIDLANQEKRELLEKEEKGRADFKEIKTLEYEKDLTDQKEAAEKEITEKLQALEQQSSESSVRLKRYFDSNKERLVKELTVQVTGE